MAITEDATTPAVVSGSGTGTTVTASFSPPANSLLVALVAGGFGTTGNTVASVTDSLSGTWSTGVAATGTNATTHGVAAVFYRYLSSAPGAMTVSVAFTNLTGGRFLAVRVLLNAASNQAAAATGTQINGVNTTSGTVSLTTTTVGSLVYGISDDAGLNDPWTPNGSTVVVGTGGNYSDAPDGCELVGWRASAATTTPGSVTLGGTWGGATKSNIAAFEVLPASAGSVTAGTASGVGSAAVASTSSVTNPLTAGGSGVASNAVVTTATGVAYVNSTNTTSAGTTSLVVTVPTGGSVGDIILFCVSNRWPDAWSVPAGLSVGLASRNGPTVGTLYYRIVQAGDPSTYTFTQTNSAVCSAVCARYSRVNQINPVRFWSSTQSNLATASTSIAFPTVQNVGGSDMNAVFVVASSSVANTTTPLLSTPATWSGRQSVIANAAGLASVATAVFDKTAATDTPSSTGYSGFYLAYNVCLADIGAPTPVLKRMPPTFRTASTASSSTAVTSLVITAPSGIVDGDLLVACTASTGGNVLTLTGTWTPLYLDTPGFDGFTVVDLITKLWFRVASSEPGSYTLGSPSGALAAAVLRYGNTDSVSPVRMLSAVDSTTVTTTSPVPAVVIGQLLNDLVLNCYTFGTDSSVSSATITPPAAGWTTRANIVTTLSPGFQCGVAITEKVNAADFPTATASVGSGWDTFSVALVGLTFAPQVMKTLSQAMNRASTY